MQVPLQITMRNIDRSQTVEERVRKRAEKLHLFSDRIVACHIVLELDQARKQHGKLYNVRLHLTIPGKELVANRNHEEDLYVAVRDAFEDLERQLEEAMRILRGDVKVMPATLLTGEVIRLFPDGDFGFISTASGKEFYFNATHLLKPHFDQLQIGTRVHFVEREGGQGPEAHRVKAIEQ